MRWKTPFSFKAAWEACRSPSQGVYWAGLCWSGGRPRWPTHYVLVLQRAILTHCYLNYKVFSLVSGCYLCYHNVETLDLLFCSCNYAWEMWYSISGIFGCELQKVNVVQDLVAMFNQRFNGKKNKLASIVFTAVLYFIWKERNERMHNDLCRAPLELAKCIIWEVLDVMGVTLQDVL
ncbi:uncharacterized protein LOC132301580 [Cornus florida]|uniref:uncharacterized protein LOC132301580 n=1 Tax=Cornus florida TaxID=4283 RepID=UPI002897C6CB|nr:uncharacterized protein LOC132301580 [Cornus florida]